MLGAVLTVVGWWLGATRYPGVLPFTETPEPAIPGVTLAHGPALTEQAYRARMTALCRAADARSKMMPPPRTRDRFWLFVEAAQIELVRQRQELAAVVPPARFRAPHRLLLSSLTRAYRANSWARGRMVTGALTRSDTVWWATELKESLEAGDEHLKAMGLAVCVTDSSRGENA